LHFITELSLSKSLKLNLVK